MWSPARRSRGSGLTKYLTEQGKELVLETFCAFSRVCSLQCAEAIQNVSCCFVCFVDRFFGRIKYDPRITRNTRSTKRHMRIANRLRFAGVRKTRRNHRDLSIQTLAIRRECLSAVPKIQHCATQTPLPVHQD